MIVAGLVLAAVGAADLVRRVRATVGRWVGLVVIAVSVIAIGIVVGVPFAGWVACLAAAGWVVALPVGERPRLGAWPVLILAVLCVAAMALFPDGGPDVDLGPRGAAPAGRVILLVGLALFLIESTNAVVRMALSARTAHPGPARQRSEHREHTASDRQAGAAGVSDDPARTVAPLDAVPQLRGGRLIGPLERGLVLALTLAQAYALVAAFVAAKGIVRFPEISKDSAAGNRAEYFLVGSMVSWVTALAGAALLWWSGG